MAVDGGIDLHREMEALDRLPPAVRKAMNESVTPPLADLVLAAMRSGMTEARVLREIEAANLKMHQRDVKDGDVAPQEDGRFQCERRKK